MASEIYDTAKTTLSNLSDLDQIKDYFKNTLGIDSIKEKSSELWCSVMEKWKDKLTEELAERDDEIKKKDEVIKRFMERTRILSTCMNCHHQFSLDNQPFNLECTHVLCSFCYANRGNVEENSNVKKSNPFQIQFGYCPLCDTLKYGIHFQYGLLASPQKLSRERRRSPRMTRQQTGMIRNYIQENLHDPSFIDKMKGLLPYSYGSRKKSKNHKKSHKK